MIYKASHNYYNIGLNNKRRPIIKIFNIIVIEMLVGPNRLRFVYFFSQSLHYSFMQLMLFLLIIYNLEHNKYI